MQIFDHNIGFWEKRQFLHKKLAKIAEDCDHNIDPRPENSPSPQYSVAFDCLDLRRVFLFFYKKLPPNPYGIPTNDSQAPISKSGDAITR
jgi:hypothetical protein